MSEGFRLQLKGLPPVQIEGEHRKERDNRQGHHHVVTDHCIDSCSGAGYQCHLPGGKQ